jgi:CheY-like chemotaxis protein
MDSQPDLILLDIWMPGMGLSVAERLRELKLRIPVIILTASGRRGVWAAAQEVGASAFIRKPYEPRQLLEIIEKTLSSPTSNSAV